MSTRPVQYEEGETLIGCAICGGCVRYPSEARILGDRKAYCYRHEEYSTGKTRQDMEREVASSRRRRELDHVPNLSAPTPTGR